MGETSYRYRRGVSREADFRFVAGNSWDGDHQSARERERERELKTQNLLSLRTAWALVSCSSSWQFSPCSHVLHVLGVGEYNENGQ